MRSEEKESGRKSGDERNRTAEASVHQQTGTAQGRANLARQGLRRVAGRGGHLARLARSRFLLQLIEATNSCARGPTGHKM
jgi:hypothetical protein